MRTKPMQLSVIAVAALAVFAVAAVMLLAGGNPAQADTTAATVAPDTVGDNYLPPEQAGGGLGPGTIDPPGPQIGDNDDFYDDPLPCSEEAQPDDETVETIADGHIALFDGFWDYEVGHLSMNFCPPSVEHTTDTDPVTLLPTTTTTRSDANIHISKTVFSVHDRYRVTVVDSGATNGNPSSVTGPKIDLAKYPFLRGAVSAVKPDPDSTDANPPNVFANNSVWWVKADDYPANPGTDKPKFLEFSTALMKKADWFKADGPDTGTEEDPPIEFGLTAVHVLVDGSPQEAHVVGAHFFAFDPWTSNTPLEEPQWSSFNTKFNKVEMFPEQYRHMQYVFTDPGQYLVQVNVNGVVRNTIDPPPPGGHAPGWKELTNEESIDSPAEWFTFHAGPQADLGVTITHRDETDNDDTTTISDTTAEFTVTATNAGPEDAKDAVVQIYLPEGLTYKADSARIGSATTAPGSSVFNYQCGVIAWQLERFANDGNLPPGDTRTATPATLTFTANVASDAVKRLTVNAEIRNTDRQALDADLSDNTDSAVVLRSTGKLPSPVFPGVTRDIVEHAIARTHAGDPVYAVNPGDKPLDYSLTGICSDWFDVHDSTAQIYLKDGRNLDYRDQWEFPLILHVSDGLTDMEVSNTAIDDSVPVTINVIDTDENAVHPTVTFTRSNPSPSSQPGLDVNRPVWFYTVQLNTELLNLPEDATPTYLWDAAYYGPTPPAYLHESTFGATSGSAGTVTYRVHVKWEGGGITASYDIEWFDP